MPEYLSGFGNLFASEALPGALPKGQNNPQKCPYGLFAEQLSGTAFTVPRKDNQRSWLYRGRPSAARCKSLLKSETLPGWVGKNFATDPNQMRWDPPQVVTTKNDIAKTTDFLDGVQIVGKAGDPCSKQGLAIYVYAANSSMANRCMSNSDGDLLLVPQAGGLLVRTEFGLIEVVPNEICVIQRGMWFQVELLQPKSLVRGYILEVYAQHFQLPELGPIGSNGLANPQDFYSPVACYDKDFPKHKRFHAYTKFGGEVFESIEDHTPFDVVAFRGNYVPFKYDLRKFMCINSVTYDHPDPSIYTVLTCPSSTPGVATADFVIFPPRWMVMENTFRPPWFHRNTMTEFMGMIWGKYDAKQGGSGKKIRL